MSLTDLSSEEDLSVFDMVALLEDGPERDLLIDQLATMDPHDPELVLRPSQLKILHDKSWISVYSGGRGAGKSMAGSYWVNEKARLNPNCRISLIGRTVADVRDTMIQGEALALDTPIPTPAGWTTMGELLPGDVVFGADGEPTTVTWVSTVAFDRPCYEVQFSDGEVVVADAEHKWTTWDHKNRSYINRYGRGKSSVVTTEQIRNTLNRSDEHKQANHAIRIARPLETDVADLPIPPYTLGVWLGDGHTHHAAVTSMDPEVVEGVIADGFRVTEWAEHGAHGLARTYGVLGLSRLLKDTGLLHHKTVPEEYLRASYAQRLELLRGLLDTDGTVCPRTGRIEFDNTNKDIIEGVVELVASLGIRCRLNVRKKKEGQRQAYRVIFHTGLPVFKIRRKADRLRAPTPEHGYRYIVSVTPVESVPVKCIAVEAEDSLYLVGRTMVPTHNSGILNCARADFMPTYTPSLRKIEWPNGAVAFTYSSDAPSQLRGPQSHFTWADELAAYRMVPDDSGATIWDNIVISTRLGDRPQILITTTPKRVTIMRDLVKQAEDKTKNVSLHSASTLANRSNLSPEYVGALFDMYAGTHLERQELYGEMVGDAAGALLASHDIGHLSDGIVMPPRKDLQIVIAVDPSVEKGRDETGVIVVGATMEPRITDRHAFVLEDLTSDRGPEEWSKIVVDAQKRWSLPGSPAIVVAEGNQGGQLISLVLKQEAPGIPVAIVRAHLNKKSRAEPVVYAYRRRRIIHTEAFEELEAEWTGWEPDVSRWSPGRIDACVWGAHVLLVDETALRPFLPIEVMGSRALPALRQAIPPYRRERGAGTYGLSAAPWRREQQVRP